MEPAPTRSGGDRQQEAKLIEALRGIGFEPPEQPASVILYRVLMERNEVHADAGLEVIEHPAVLAELLECELIRHGWCLGDILDGHVVMVAKTDLEALEQLLSASQYRENSGSTPV